MKNYLKVIAVLAIVLSYKLIFNFEFPIIGIDDANIYFRYVKNIYNGFGMVWNPNGERVEGFTSFIWAEILVVIYSIAKVKFEYWVLGLSFFIVSYILLIVYRLLLTITKDDKISLFGVLVLTLLPGFVDWNIYSLMETGIWVLFITILLERLIIEKFDWLFFICIVLLPIVRPEGILFSSLIIGLKILNEWVNKDKNIISLIKKNIVYIILVLFSNTIIFIVRYNYFGFPFPNTYYAKVSDSRLMNLIQGGKYIIMYILTSPILAYIMVSTPILLLTKIKKNNLIPNKNILLAVFVLISFLIPFLTGGDHFPYFRYFQHIVPISIVLIMYKIYEKNYQHKYLILLGVLVLSQISFNPIKFDLFASSSLSNDVSIAKRDRNYAIYMNSMFKNDYPEVGMITVGGFGYIYEGKVNDLLALNNVEMAHHAKDKKGESGHASFDKDVFFKQLPDIILPLAEMTEAKAISNINKNLSGKSGTSKYLKYIFHDPRFLKFYSIGKLKKNNDILYGNFLRSYISNLPSEFKYEEYKLNSDFTKIEQ